MSRQVLAFITEALTELSRQRKIRIRLHGTRLSRAYTFVLRLDRSTDFTKLLRNPRKRQRRTAKRHDATIQTPSLTSSSSPSDVDSPFPTSMHKSKVSDVDTRSTIPDDDDDTNLASASDAENNEVDQQIHLNNAYPGAANSIGSVHQRRWFITLDRPNSGFELDTREGRKRWVRRRSVDGEHLFGFEPFYVRGPEVETSVVTGRLGREVFEDEGVHGFVRRKGWRPVLY